MQYQVLDFYWFWFFNCYHINSESHKCLSCCFRCSDVRILAALIMITCSICSGSVAKEIVFSMLAEVQLGSEQIDWTGHLKERQSVCSPLLDLCVSVSWHASPQTVTLQRIPSFLAFHYCSSTNRRSHHCLIKTKTNETILACNSAHCTMRSLFSNTALRFWRKEISVECEWNRSLRINTAITLPRCQLECAVKSSWYFRMVSLPVPPVWLRQIDKIRHARGCGERYRDGREKMDKWIGIIIIREEEISWKIVRLTEKLITLQRHNRRSQTDNVKKHCDATF